MLFYFTGTGNSLYVAQKIAEAEDDSLISIHDAVKRGEYSFESEKKIGFVYPCYYYGLPATVKEFLEKLTIPHAESSYIYSVVTCGSKTGGTSRMCREVLAARGLKLSAAFVSRQVDNFVPMLSLPSPEGIREVIELNEDEIAVTISRIANSVSGDFDKYKGMFPDLRTKCMYPVYDKVRVTKDFRLHPQRCIGCGLCARACNSEAIELREKRPVWVLEKCDLCLKCLHKCKAEAIEFGKKTNHRGRYFHPDVDWKWTSGKKPGA